MGEDWRGGYGRRSIERLNRRLAMGQVRNQPDSPILPPDIPGLVLWLRSDLGVTAVMSAVASAGTAPPVVTLTGTPSPLLSVEIDITTPGLRGIALFQWKLGGVVQQTNLVTGANVALGTGTLAAQFTGGASVYVADNVYTATVQVSAWADQSGLGHTMLQATGPLQPRYLPTGGVGGGPEILFDGVTQFMAASFALAQPWTCAFTYNQLALGGVNTHDVPIDGFTSATSVLTAQNNAGHRWSMYAGIEVDAGLNFANGVYAATTMIWNGASSSGRVNALQVLAGNVGAGVPAGITLATLGGGSAIRACNIKIHEVIAYSSALSGTALAALEMYTRQGIY